MAYEDDGVTEERLKNILNRHREKHQDLSSSRSTNQSGFYDGWYRRTLFHYKQNNSDLDGEVRTDISSAIAYVYDELKKRSNGQSIKLDSKPALNMLEETLEGALFNLKNISLTSMGKISEAMILAFKDIRKGCVLGQTDICGPCFPKSDLDS